jgi:hypothetical protein
MGATVLPFQAFDDTRIAVIASAVPMAPPSVWFDNPKLDGPTALTITKDGQVFGHAALWDTCHIGKPGQCMTPPHSASNYAYFTTGAVVTAEGTEVPVGPITLGTGHAGLTLNGQNAAEHYDNTGTAIADVATGEDSHGIWMAGAIRPTATDDRLYELRAATISGDWRGLAGGGHELVALLAVNTPGFPVPRTRATFADEKQLALVAAGMLTSEEDDEIPAIVGEELTVATTAVVDSVIAGGVIELGSDMKKKNKSDPTGDDEGVEKATGTDEPADEEKKEELTDEERVELMARLDVLETALVALAASSLELNVGSGQKCPECGGTVAAGRSTCQNCGASM